jgi:cobalt/nickel transport system permease protein
MAKPNRDALILGAWVILVFGLSLLRTVAHLGAATLLMLLLFHRGLGRNLWRTLCSIVPLSAALSLVSLALLRLTSGAWPACAPFFALALRTALIGFVTFSLLERIQLLRALRPFPLLSRLLVVTLAQIHALRLIAHESSDGLRSRMPHSPGVLDLLRNAGGITAMLFTLAVRNARDISDAMRSRGF